MNPLSRIADIAEAQIGTEEDSAHTNRGAAILKYQQATSLAGQGWPWCAAFVDWCIEQAMLEHPELFGLTFAQRPQTASAFGLQEWAQSKFAVGCHVFASDDSHCQPGRGDIVVYKFSHCGIVAAGVDARGLLHTVEGNTNNDGSRDGYEVCAKTRPLRQVRCFITLPLKAQLVAFPKTISPDESHTLITPAE